MSLLNEFLETGQEVIVETSDAVISAIGVVQAGEYGDYKHVIINKSSKIVDCAKLINEDLYTPGCTASVTIKQYEKGGATKLSVIGIVFKQA